MKRGAGAPRRILIVDGYNVINVRKPVRESRGLEDARRALTDRLHDYAGWSGQEIVLVYDAWLSDRMQRSVETRGPLKLVFTMKGETADCYIERLCDELAEDVALRRAEVRVATSDLIEQTIAFGRGAGIEHAKLRNADQHRGGAPAGGDSRAAGEHAAGRKRIAEETHDQFGF